jgi:hypothetical protein
MVSLMAYDLSRPKAKSFVKISNWIWDCEREVSLPLTLSPTLPLSLARLLALPLPLPLPLPLFLPPSLFLSRVCDPPQWKKTRN